LFGDAHLIGDVGPGGRRHRDDAGHLPGDLHLHAEEAVPAAQRDLAPDGGGVGQVEVSVDGDGVVEGGDDRPAVLHQAQHAPTETLVVVDQVELASPAGQLPTYPPAEGERLGESGGAHEPEFGQVDGG